MRTLLILLALLIPRVATANKTIGVLVTGEVLKGPTQQQAEKWLRGHGQKVATNALPTDAVKILLDCFVLDDPKCSRSVIDARATTSSVVSIRVEVTSKKHKEIRLTIDWFVKGHNPVSARRTCENCTEAVLRSTLDAMMLDLAKTTSGFMGRLKVTSDPAGITVLLDNATIGVTPIEHDVTVGPHVVKLVRDGRMSEEKAVTVESGTLAEVALVPPAAGLVDERPPPPPPVERPSRVFPTVLITIGLAGAGVGGAMIAFGGPKGKTINYTDFRTPGYGVAIGGGVLAITGVIIILATGSSSTPTVAMTPGGATVGWAGRF